VKKRRTCAVNNRPLFKGALQLLMNRYDKVGFAQVPERVSTKRIVVLIIGNSKSNHLGAQGTFKELLRPFGSHGVRVRVNSPGSTKPGNRRTNRYTETLFDRHKEKEVKK